MQYVIQWYHVTNVLKRISLQNKIINIREYKPALMSLFVLAG